MEMEADRFQRLNTTGAVQDRKRAVAAEMTRAFRAPTMATKSALDCFTQHTYAHTRFGLLADIKDCQPLRLQWQFTIDIIAPSTQPCGSRRRDARERPVADS